MSKKVEETIKEKVLEKVEEAKETVEATKEKPTKEEGSFKIKKVTKPKQLGDEKLVPDLVKVDLSKPKKEKQDAIQVGETKEVAVGEQTGDSVKVDEQVQESSETVEEPSPIQEITEEERGSYNYEWNEDTGAWDKKAV